MAGKESTRRRLTDKEQQQLRAFEFGKQSIMLLGKMNTPVGTYTAETQLRRLLNDAIPLIGSSKSLGKEFVLGIQRTCYIPPRESQPRVIIPTDQDAFTQAGYDFAKAWNCMNTQTQQDIKPVLDAMPDIHANKGYQLAFFQGFIRYAQQLLRAPPTS